MASRSICITTISILAVLCGTRGGAPSSTESSCNEDDFLSCLESNTEFLKKETMGNDIPVIIEEMCRAKVKPCTEIPPLDKCPEDSKTQIIGLKKSLEATFDALCEKDGTLFKELAKTLECWIFADFESCLETIKFTAPGLDLLTAKRNQKDWINFNAELPKCIDYARYKSEECKGADVSPVKKVIESFFAHSNRLNNGSEGTSAASILTAFISLFVSLAFSRQS